MQTPSAKLSRHTQQIARFQTASSAARPLLWPVTRQDHLAPTFWRDLSRIAGQWLALFSLLFVFIGPMLDHHYAQRQPHHTHIYLRAYPAAKHTHPSPAHSHAHDDAHSPSLHGDGGGVISVPTTNEITAQSNRAPAPLLLLLPFTFSPGATGLAQTLAPRLLPTHEFFLPPPEKPPRVVLRLAR